MRHGLFTFLVMLTLADSLSMAQTADTPPAKSFLPGLELSALPDVLYAQMPQLPPGHGLVVERIAADVPGGLTALQRYDVLLSYDGKTITGVEQLQRLMQANKPDHKAALVVLRGGKELSLKLANFAVNLASPIKGAIKAGGPPAVDIECTFLEGGKMQINLQYYSEKSSKLESVLCNGSLPEIEKQVRDQRLPSRVQEMVDVAFKRLRNANPR